MNWHLAGLAKVMLVSSQLMGHLCDAEPSPEEGAGFTVLWEYEVVVIQRSSCANARSFFTKLSHVKRDSTLSLRRVVNNVSLIYHNHLVIHLHQKLVRDFFSISRSHNVALFVHHAEALDLVEFVPKCHFTREAVLEQAFVHFSHSAEVTH